jgi:N-acetylneuraminic acid mutarotase
MRKHSIFWLALFSFCLARDVRGQGSWSEDSTNGFAPVGTAASCVINGKIYVIGGANSPIFGSLSDTVQIFDPQTHIWLPAPSLPFVCSSPSCNFVDGKIYVFGGYENNSDSLPSNTLEIFDTSTELWSKGPNMPVARSGQESCVIDGKIFIMGGFGNASNDILNSIDVFNPSTEQWSTAPPMLFGRAFFALNIVDGKIYVMGGYGGVAYDSTEIFDSASNAWSVGPSMPIGMSEGASCVLDGKIYVMGGPNYFNKFEIFDPLFSTWIIGPDMPIACSDLIAQAVNGKIYAIGGLVSTGDAIDANEVFTPGPLSVQSNKDTSSRSTILLFPNPASDALQITSEQSGILHLFDLMGRERMNDVTDGTGATLDVSHLEAGMYFLRLGNESAKVEIAH